jgi:hypothetical protein
MDPLALAAVIVAGVSAASTGINAFYNTRRTAKTAQEGRAEQRAADGYLKVLSLAEQEARWLDPRVFNLGLDPREKAYFDISVEVPEPPGVTDKATAAALVAAFASPSVWEAHNAWRDAADAVGDKIKWIELSMAFDGDAGAKVPDDWMKELTEDLQPKERTARQLFAEAVAAELGHRRQQPARRLSLRGHSRQ